MKQNQGFFNEKQKKVLPYNLYQLYSIDFAKIEHILLFLEKKFYKN